MLEPVRISQAPTRIRPIEGRPFLLDLGCGDNKISAEHFGIDIAPTKAADAVLDLTQFPWPIDDEAADAIHCSHFFEHLTGAQRMPFMDECWRIMRPAMQMVIIVPYWSSMRAIQDPTHAWPPVCETSFLYFNKKWRDDNKLSHYPIKCDWDFSYGYALDSDLMVRNMEFQQFATKHYIQAINDLQVTLTKR